MDLRPSAPFTALWTIRFTHTDPSGYVFFPRYFNMLHGVLEEWFTDAIRLPFADLILKRRIGTPTAAIQCQFLRPCRLGEKLSVAVRIDHIGTTSLRLRFQGRVDGELRLDALSTLVITDLDSGRPQAIPDDLRARLEAYRQGDRQAEAPQPIAPRWPDVAQTPEALRAQLAAAPFAASLPVRFTHTDPAGYVFFPRYFDMLQAAVEDWFTNALGQSYADLYNLRRLGTPAAATQARFARPSRMGDRLSVAVLLEHLGTSSLRLRFFGTGGGELRLEAVSTLVMISRDDGRPRPVPDDLRSRMAAYGRGAAQPASAPPER